ncbi:WD40 repeat domain-containing protein [Streptomyces sp. 4N124]|uniref:WD40 repeat domain-containing protein n=1 Tax=Streptomyces sp. 4N124 TaxID=3457420 RepID=UPI003FD51633
MRQMIAQEITRISSGFGHAVRPMLEVGQDGQALLFSSVPDGSEVHRWDLRTGELVWCYDEGMSGCNDMALTRLPGGGVSLAVATEDGVEWLDAWTGRHRPELTWEGWTIWDLSVGLVPEGRPVLVGAGHDGEVYRWDGVSGALLGSSPGGERTSGTVLAVGFVPLPDGAGVIVSGDENGWIRRWDAVTGDPVGEAVEGHTSKIRIVKALPSAGESGFVSSDQKGLLRRWNVLTGAPIGPSIETGTDVFALATADVSGGGLLFASGADEIIRAWDADTGEAVELSVQGAVVSALAQPDGTAFLATSTALGDIVVQKCAFVAE